MASPTMMTQRRYVCLPSMPIDLLTRLSQERNQFDNPPVFKRRDAQTASAGNEVKRFFSSPTVPMKNPIQ